ncbi:hypothetical protein, partial [Vibrio alginolyticus]|uniref:hypothetical protein n=1 Tax=Vibrio alginolyticus TaxID=663 RepID=UPI00215CB743
MKTVKLGKVLPTLHFVFCPRSGSGSCYTRTNCGIPHYFEFSLIFFITTSGVMSFSFSSIRAFITADTGTGFWLLIVASTAFFSSSLYLLSLIRTVGISFSHCNLGTLILHK